MSNYGTDWQALRSDELETALRTAKAHLEWWVSFWGVPEEAEQQIDRTEAVIAELNALLAKNERKI